MIIRPSCDGSNLLPYMNYVDNESQSASQRIADLTTMDVELLSNDGIKSEDDLSYCTFEVLNVGLGIVKKRRKLEYIAKFLARRTDELSDTITMETIQARVEEGNSWEAAAAAVDNGAGLILQSVNLNSEAEANE